MLQTRNCAGAASPCGVSRAVASSGAAVVPGKPFPLRLHSPARALGGLGLETGPPMPYPPEHSRPGQRTGRGLAERRTTPVVRAAAGAPSGHSIPFPLPRSCDSPVPQAWQPPPARSSCRGAHLAAWAK